MSLISEYIADGATAIYDMEEASPATVAVDASGFSHPGTYTAPTFTSYQQSGLVPTAPGTFSAGYTNAQAMLATSGTWHDNPSAFSVACRFKQVGTPGANPTLISKYGPSFGVSQFILRLDSGKLTFYGFRGGGLFAATGATTIVAGVEYTGHATWDGTTAKVYLNGVLDGSAVNAGALNSSSVNFTVGNRNNAGSGPNTGEGASLWAGSIDAAAYFPTTLTPTRVLAHHVAATVIPAASLLLPNPVNRLRPLLVR